MPKADNSSKKLESDIDKKRIKILERFFRMEEKVLKHIEESMEAVIPCICKGLNDKCPSCLGTGKKPDLDQRNWAAEQAGDRIAPKPKAIEIGPDKTAERNELEKQVKELPDSDLDSQLKALGVVINEEDKR